MKAPKQAPDKKSARKPILSKDSGRLSLKWSLHPKKIMLLGPFLIKIADNLIETC